MPGYANAGKVLSRKVKFKDIEELEDENLEKAKNTENRRNYIPFRE